ncbi:hypothetical protein Aph01nite_73760 [Acrocarpospora phusangensis]|uniref:DUF2993 domain-containing protein n=1 Tax=Acrocarpospora phusangensis TaxID=1070424 RepID=A0A919QHS7_9ACTN|nr:DUF2993 domain-containing protein [Acrocarpospora phusangensis]GIH29066.1 hypothetical protein Aph01nite_73760 [Acrocarpospora phusangensis]
MRKLLVSVLVLGIVLVVLDRVAVVGVQREVARQIEAAYKLSATPTVTVNGIPFLTQAIAGRYEEVTIEMGDLTQEGVTLSSAQATLYGVHAPLMDLIQNAEAVDLRAERVSGTVVISYKTLDARAPRGIKVNGGGNGTIQVSGELNVLGQAVPVTADMKVELVKNQIRVTPASVKIAGGVPVPNAERLVSFAIPIRELPLNLKLTKVTPVEEGLLVQGTADDVPLRS